jgi:hypothetical protein
MTFARGASRLLVLVLQRTPSFCSSGWSGCLRSGVWSRPHLWRYEVEHEPMQFGLTFTEGCWSQLRFELTHVPSVSHERSNLLLLKSVMDRILTCCRWKWWVWCRKPSNPSSVIVIAICRDSLIDRHSSSFLSFVHYLVVRTFVIVFPFSADLCFNKSKQLVQIYYATFIMNYRIRPADHCYFCLQETLFSTSASEIVRNVFKRSESDLYWSVNTFAGNSRINGGLRPPWL